MLKRKTAILGASGFIGRNLFEKLEPLRPVAVDRIASDFVKFPMDLRTGVPDLFGCKAVVCCASNAHVWGKPVDVMHEAKLVSRMVQAAHTAEVDVFIHLSSSSVYGDGQGSFTELDVCRPKSDYGQQKLYAEDALFAWCNKNGRSTKTRVVSVRVFNALGRYQRRTMFPYLLAENAINGKVTPLFTASGRSWTPVSRLCEFLAYLTNEETYSQLSRGTFTVANFGTPVLTSHWDLIRLVSKSLRARGLPAPKVNLVDYLRPGESGAYRCNMAVTRRTFPSMPLPLEDIDSAVDDVVDTVVENLAVDLNTKALVSYDTLRAY